MLEREPTWTELKQDNKGRPIGGDVWGICDECFNHITRGLESICGGTYDLKPHCGAFLCDEHLTAHERRHEVVHYVKPDVELDGERS